MKFFYFFFSFFCMLFGPSCTSAQVSGSPWQIDSTGYSYWMSLDSCTGHDISGNPIVHYTIAVTSPFSLPRLASLHGQNLDNATLTMVSNQVSPFPVTTYLTGTFIDTVQPTARLNFTLSFTNLHGDSADSFVLIIPNRDPCGDLCRSTLAVPTLKDCGYDSAHSSLGLYINIYVNYLGTRGSSFLLSSNVPSQIVIPQPPEIIDHGTGIPIGVIDTGSFARPYIVSIIILDSVYGVCPLHIPIDSGCHPLNTLYDCHNATFALNIDSCLGQDTSGRPIVHYTLTVNNRLSDSCYVFVLPVNLDEPIVTKEDGDVAFPLSTSYIRGTFVDTVGLTDSLIFNIGLSPIGSDTICLYAVTIPNVAVTCSTPAGIQYVGKVMAGISLAPNPSSTKSVAWHQTEGNEAAQKIVVTDLMGNIVIQINDLKHAGSIVLDSEKIAPGMYIVSLYEYDVPIASVRWGIVR